MSSAMSLLAVFLLVLLVGNAIAHGGRQQHQRLGSEPRARKFEDLRLRKPREIFKSEGGKIEAWDPNEHPALCDAELGVERVTLEPHGLAVPCYKDAPLLKVITKGSGKAGILNPLADKVIERSVVFHIKKGDVIVLPRGTASWFYNDGNERVEILEVGDTSANSQCGCFKTFQLAGGKRGKEFGSVLHGFSKDLLTHAWDVDKDTVQHMLQAQEEAAIIKLDESRRISMPAYSTNILFKDYVYHWADTEPDVKVKDGGELRLLNSLKFPILKNVNLGAACVKMQRGALTAPGWVHNAHQVLYVEGGSGRIQVVRENGEQALDAELEQGSLVIIPANYPCVKLAGDDGFRFAAIFTSDVPIASFLAGRNSVYRGIPREVVASSLGLDEATERELLERRSEEVYFLPPKPTKVEHALCADGTVRGALL